MNKQGGLEREREGAREVKEGFERNKRSQDTD